MMLRLAIVATLVTYVSTCCQPSQYEAHVGVSLGTFNKTTKVGNYMEISIQLTVDYTNKMIAQTQTLVVGTDKSTIQQTMVMDYNQGIVYLERNGTCDKYKLGAMQNNCFSEDNSQVMNYGLGKNLVSARGYRQQYNDTTVYMSVTADTCLPIATDIVHDSAESYAVEFQGYNNITMGIKSTQVFGVSTACAQGGPLKPELPLINGKRAVMGFLSSN